VAVRARPPASLPSPEQPSATKVQIPNLVTDLTWSLDIFPVEVLLCGRVFTIPEHPASWWMAQILSEEWGIDLFPGCLPNEEQDEVYDLMVDGEVTVEDLSQVLLDMISTVSGRPWWVALRLVSVLQQNWGALGGELLFRGMDPSKMSFSAWLDVSLYLIMRNIEGNKATMFTLQLEVPPPEAKPEQVPEQQAGMSADAFLSMA
jgi:hypothetical protein